MSRRATVFLGILGMLTLMAAACSSSPRRAIDAEARVVEPALEAEDAGPLAVTAEDAGPLAVTAEDAGPPTVAAADAGPPASGTASPDATVEPRRAGQGSTEEQGVSLSLLLTVRKNSFKIGEPVEVTVGLRNEAGRPVTVNRRMAFKPLNYGPGGYGNVSFRVSNPPGHHPVRGTLVDPADPERNDFAALDPGQEITRSFVLSRSYWMGTPSSYRVTAVYRNSDRGQEYGLSAWTGELVSGELVLRITK